MAPQPPTEAVQTNPVQTGQAATVPGRPRVASGPPRGGAVARAGVGAGRARLLPTPPMQEAPATEAVPTAQEVAPPQVRPRRRPVSLPTVRGQQRAQVVLRAQVGRTGRQAPGSQAPPARRPPGRGSATRGRRPCQPRRRVPRGPAGRPTQRPEPAEVPAEVPGEPAGEVGTGTVGRVGHVRPPRRRPAQRCRCPSRLPSQVPRVPRVPRVPGRGGAVGSAGARPSAGTRSASTSGPR